MRSRDDFLELNLYLEDLEDEDQVDLWVTCRDRSMLKFDNVRHNPVRWHGVWSITHDFLNQKATSTIPADEVWYFTTVSKWDNRPEQDRDEEDEETEALANLYLTDETDNDPERTEEDLEAVYRAESVLKNGHVEMEEGHA